MKFEFYEVGGKIRDEILGLTSKDVDYSVVISGHNPELTADQLFTEMLMELQTKRFEVFEQRPEAFTIRAMFPKYHQYSGVADFVLSRKEVGYNTESRLPRVEIGTLHDDLLRRDFTVNAIAKDSEGNLIDPFNGQIDITHGILRTPTDAGVSFYNDPLRILRAFRFMVTKSFTLSDEIVDAISLFDPMTFLTKISVDRVRDELTKMLKHSTPRTLDVLFWLRNINPSLYNVLWEHDLWLMPTTKK